MKAVVPDTLSMMDGKPGNRTLGESAQWVVDGLTARGIEVNPSSRLGRFARQFAKNAYTGPWGPNDQALLIEGLTAMRSAYRVLLTRARQGMVIVVPSGDRADPTRAPGVYDATFEYLQELGVPVLA